MADPMKVGPKTRQANRSDLMRALDKASLGEKVSFCPFGCTHADVDVFGYCHHLVGFAFEDGKTFEAFDPPGEDGRRAVDGRNVRDVLGTDKLVRITTNFRVYREDAPDPEGKKGRRGKREPAAA